VISILGNAVDPNDHTVLRAATTQECAYALLRRRAHEGSHIGIRVDGELRLSDIVISGIMQTPQCDACRSDADGICTAHLRDAAYPLPMQRKTQALRPKRVPMLGGSRLITIWYRPKVGRFNRKFHLPRTACANARVQPLCGNPIPLDGESSTHPVDKWLGDLRCKSCLREQVAS